MKNDSHTHEITLNYPPLALEAALEHLEVRQLLRVALLAAGLLWLRLLRTPRRWMARSRQRAALADLNDHLLRDIGLDRSAVRGECRKWFWRA